jgi:phospholipid transport system substrate-binding protein
MKIRKFVAVLFALGAFSAFAADMAPDELVKNTANEVLSILKKDKEIQAGDTQKVMALVEAKVLPHFDFTHMTRLAVGRGWSKASDAQKEQLITEFRTLLVRTYSTALTQYKNQTIEYKPSQVAADEKEVTVKSVINQPGGQPISIDYRMAKTGDGWKAFDIAVEGVSLVTNYRGSFNSIVEQSGIDGLIKSLAEKNKSNAAK